MRATNRRLSSQSGGKVFACGRDPFFPAWPDVLQLNAFQPGLRQAVIETIAGHRRAVRRHPLRHGHARAQQHLRAHMGSARRSEAGRRLLADDHPGDQSEVAGLQVHRRGLLGP